MTAPTLACAEVPPCDVNHAGQDRDWQRNHCRKCRDRGKYLKRLRRERIRAGAKPRNPLDYPSRGCTDHGRVYHKGCPGCKEYSRYDCARRRLLRRQGKIEPQVPIDIVQTHLTALLDKQTGGWTNRTLSAKSGINRSMLYQMVAGYTAHVRADTWNALRVLQPLGRPGAPHIDAAPALETQRILQGLTAQGWKFQHMAGLLGVTSADYIRQLADGKPGYGRPRTAVKISTRDAVRALRDKLGPYDVNVMHEPLPGMSPKTAAYAARRHWVPLRAWTGQDLTDPAAVPYRGKLHIVPPADDHPTPAAGRRRPGPSEMPFIDPSLESLIRRNVETFNITDIDHGRRPDGYIVPLGRLTRLELHAVVGLADDLGLFDASIALMLGYPDNNTKQIDAGKRSVQRYLTTVKNAREWMAAEPTGEPPAWYTQARVCFDDMIPPMLALQPAPFGPGWDAAELAGRCGLDLEDLWPFLRRAAEFSNRFWRNGRQDTKTAAA